MINEIDKGKVYVVPLFIDDDGRYQKVFRTVTEAVLFSYENPCLIGGHWWSEDDAYGYTLQYDTYEPRLIQEAEELHILREWINTKEENTTWQIDYENWKESVGYND